MRVTVYWDAPANAAIFDCSFAAGPGTTKIGAIYARCIDTTELFG